MYLIRLFICYNKIVHNNIIPFKEGFLCSALKISTDRNGAKEQQNRTALITAVKIDNLLRDLQTDITPASQIEFIDMTQEDGRLAYQRSVLFIMMASVNLLYPDKEVVVEHSVNNGVYCELLPKGDLTAEDVVRIEAKMREFIEKKKDIFKVSLPREDAVALFRESQQIENQN